MTVHQKPRPADIDGWSHCRYDATGNAVSRDKRVGPPGFLRWEATPRWNHGTKTSNLVSAQGRLFFILDDSHFASSTRTWSLIARDAYNGIQLWRHEIDGWEGAQRGKKVGPAQVNRRLVAVDNRVYATLGEAAPVSVLDAATGKILRVLQQTSPAREFIVSNGVLLALVNSTDPAAIRRGRSGRARIVALDPDTGTPLWEHNANRILPLTLAADDKQAVYHDGRTVKSLELNSGDLRWTSAPTGQKVVSRDTAHPDRPGAEKSTIILAPQFAPTMVLYNDVVAFAGGCQLNVLSASDGRELWKAQYPPSNYSVPVDLFGFDGYLWGPDLKMNQWRPTDDNVDFNAYDPMTGQIVKRVRGNYGFRFQHHRCHQMKVVDSTVLAGRAGIEFLDTETGEMSAHHWVRGSCYYGIMPANGLLYVPPHNCACYIRAKLSGFNALSATLPLRSAVIPDDRRLQHGPAYGTTRRTPGRVRPEDWPTYRHDIARSGRSGARVGSELLLGWETKLVPGLTSPVIADGRVYLASTDDNGLYALDASTGKMLWQYSFDAGVDSPPTVHQGMVVCGCRDGSVYAFRATDGELAWKFLACPEQRLIVSRGKVESVWPVNGSVLLLENTVYFASGRTSYLDGGIQLYGLDLHTGRKMLDITLSTRGADGSELLDEESVDGFLNDVLSSDGDRLFMRHQVLDRAGKVLHQRIPHLHSPDGFFSSNTTTRLLWTYAPVYTSPHQGAFYDRRLSRALFPSGRILVEDDHTIYGFGENHYEKMNTEPGGQWALFSAAKENGVPLDLTAREYRKLAMSGKKSVRFHWWNRIPIQAWAMVKTKNTLFVAGPPGRGVISPAALDGTASGRLLAVSPADGRILSEISLPSRPVWDGMAAAGGSLYLSLADDRVLCLWPVDSGRSGTPLTPAGWKTVLPRVKREKEPGLVGRWRFNEGVGLLARDCSGHGNDAEVFGEWAEGDFGNCIVANAAPRAVVIPDAPDLQFGNDDFSLALWVKVDGYDVRLLGKEAFPENWWVINLLPDGRAELVLGQGRGLTVRPKTTSSLATEAWNHLVAVIDCHAKEARLYLNGRLEGHQAIPDVMTKGLNVAGRDIAIPSKHKPFRGLIGDLRIYRRALSPEYVKKLFQIRASRRNSTTFQARE